MTARLLRTPSMLGPPKPTTCDEAITVSLDELVPWGHVSSHIYRTLDLGFVRDLVRGTYAEIGRRLIPSFS